MRQGTLQPVMNYLNRQAAQELGRPTGTVVSRLARARQVLARRLARRGVLPGLVLGSALSAEVLRAAVPAALAGTTARAGVLCATGQGAATGTATARVLALTLKGMKPMWMTKVKAVLAVV